MSRREWRGFMHLSQLTVARQLDIRGLSCSYWFRYCHPALPLGRPPSVSSCLLHDHTFLHSDCPCSMPPHCPGQPLTLLKQRHCLPYNTVFLCITYRIMTGKELDLQRKTVTYQSTVIYYKEEPHFLCPVLSSWLPKLNNAVHLKPPEIWNLHKVWNASRQFGTSSSSHQPSSSPLVCI